METPKELLFKEFEKLEDQTLPNTDQCRIVYTKIENDHPSVQLNVVSDAEQINEHTFEKLMQALYDISSRIAPTDMIKITGFYINGGVQNTHGFDLLSSDANLVDHVIKKYLVTATFVNNIPEKIKKDHYLLPTATVERANKALQVIQQQKNRPQNLINKLEHYAEGEIELNVLTSMRETMRFRYEFTVIPKNIVVYPSVRNNYAFSITYMYRHDDNLELTCIETDPEKLQLIHVIGKEDRIKILEDFYHKLNNHLKKFNINVYFPNASTLELYTKIKFPEVD